MCLIADSPQVDDTKNKSAAHTLSLLCFRQKKRKNHYHPETKHKHSTKGEGGQKSQPRVESLRGR